MAVIAIIGIVAIIAVLFINKKDWGLRLFYFSMSKKKLVYIERRGLTLWKIVVEYYQFLVLLFLE